MNFWHEKLFFQLQMDLYAFRDICGVWNQTEKYKANEHMQNWKVGQKKLLPYKYIDQKPISSLPALEIKRLLSSCQQNGRWELAKESHVLLLEKIFHDWAWHIYLSLYSGSKID